VFSYILIAFAIPGATCTGCSVVDAVCIGASLKGAGAGKLADNGGEVKGFATT
jgi:hypothetical protein